MYWLSDDFADPAFDYAMWHVASHGSGVDGAERNGRLEFSITPDVATEGIHGVDEHYGTNCRLKGDFDARVEFKLLTWPPGNGTYMTLGAYFPSGDGFLSISRQGRPTNGGSEAYASSVGAAGVVQTADLVGALRLTRVNGVLTAYYRYAQAWVEFGSERAARPAQVLLGLYSNADQFGHLATTAAFDNFRATAEAVDCPGVPLPPRKPRP